MPRALPLRPHGVTIVELLIAVAVLAILLAAASPSFADFFERYRLRSAADDTLTLFAEARQAAVEADRNITLSFVSSASGWCTGAAQAAEPAAGSLVSDAPTACDCAAAPAACRVGGDVLVVSSAGRVGVTITSGAATTFTYDSKGGTLTDVALAPQVMFQSSSAKYGLRVDVNALGQARACVPIGKRPIPGYPACS